MRLSREGIGEALVEARVAGAIEHRKSRGLGCRGLPVAK